MAKLVRVNLSVPAETDGVLARLAALSGVSKSALVMLQLARALPYWRRDLAVLERGVAVVSGSGERSLDPVRLRSPASRAKRPGRKLRAKEVEIAEWNARVEAERSAKG